MTERPQKKIRDWHVTYKVKPFNGTHFTGAMDVKSHSKVMARITVYRILKKRWDERFSIIKIMTADPFE